jgi:hypothetical protein
MNAESGPKAAPQVAVAKRDHEQSTAELRASALALDTAAVAAGKWPASAEILDALAELSAAVVWDLHVDNNLVDLAAAS